MSLISRFSKLSLADQLGAILGGLSIITLIRSSIYEGFGPTFTGVIDYYEQIATTLLGWLEPVLLTALGVLASAIDVDVTLFPHWKHIFILMFVYFSRDASLAYANGFRPTGVFMFSFGALYALLAGVSSGLVELKPQAFGANFTFAAAPVFGILAYNLTCQLWFSRADSQRAWLMRPMQGDNWLSRFVGTIPGSVIQALGGLVVVLVGLQLPFVSQSPSPGLIMLMLLIVMLGFNCVWFAAQGIQVTTGGNWWDDLFSKPGAKVGFAMLNTFLVSMIFVLSNAGLGVFGL